jgi:hypothetical protein
MSDQRCEGWQGLREHRARWFTYRWIGWPSLSGSSIAGCARLRRRSATTEADVDGRQAQFEVPDAAELDGVELADTPPARPSWLDWAADRWPSLSDR